MPVQWSSASRTDVGKSRAHNEDSVLERPDLGLWVVADGMGGHAAGDVASQMITETLNGLKKPKNLASFVRQVEDSLLEVNMKLLDLAKERGENTTIGSTVVALLGFDDYCVYLWAGDSRAYRIRKGEFMRMTQDHSQAEVYVEQGIMTPEEAAVHPAANMVTRAIGATPDLRLDMDIEQLIPGDRYLLCSDGLDKHLSDDEIEQLMSKGDPETATNSLVEQVLDRGAIDNITIVIVDIAA